MAIRWLYHTRIPSLEEAIVSAGFGKGPDRALVATNQALNGLTVSPDHASLVILGPEEDFELLEIADVEEKVRDQMPNATIEVGVGIRESDDGIIHVVIISSRI